MEWQVAAVRAALDRAGHPEVGVLAYAVKFASAFYGPFRDAVRLRADGDRMTYQMDLQRRAGRHGKAGAGLPDLVSPSADTVDVRWRPISIGEYAMVEAAARAWLTAGTSWRPCCRLPGGSHRSFHLLARSRRGGCDDPLSTDPRPTRPASGVE